MLQFVEPDAEPTVMTVFAHPDDAELSCFGLLSRLRDEGWKVVMAIATRGENGADIGEWDRVNEATEAAELIGANVVFGSFVDGYVSKTKELITWVEDLLLVHRPTLIVTHFTGEAKLAHQDHVAVEGAVHVAMRRADWLPDLVLAEGIENDPSFRPNWFVNIGAYFDCKQQAIAIHSSQAAKHYMEAEYTELRARRWDLHFPDRDVNASPRFWEAFMMVRQIY